MLQNFKIIHDMSFFYYFSVEASFEEDVRRYLARKPMTTTEILRKMTQKRPNFPKEDIMPLLVNILKRINPHKQKIKGQMYFTIKAGIWLNLGCFNSFVGSEPPKIRNLRNLVWFFKMILWKTFFFFFEARA